jgi:hypothetical protein
MAYEDSCRLSALAVITDDQQRVLLIKSAYGATATGEGTCREIGFVG